MNTLQLETQADAVLNDTPEPVAQLTAFDLELIAGGQATVNTI
jgi:hypothetical protein